MKKLDTVILEREFTHAGNFNPCCDIWNIIKLLFEWVVILNSLNAIYSHLFYV